MVLGEVIPYEWLTTILVNSLQNLALVKFVPAYRIQVSNLVSGSVPKPWEEGEELAPNWRSSLVFEDDQVQLGGGGNLANSQ